MLVSAWLLFIVFGFISLDGIAKLLTKPFDKEYSVFMIFCFFVTALTAGIIFGGLRLPIQ